MLLELGLWESLSHLDGGALLNPPPNNTTAETAEAAQTRILKHVKRRLGFYAGEKYRNVVITCLQGAFERIEHDDRMGTKLGKEFKRTVVDVLGALGGVL